MADYQVQLLCEPISATRARSFVLDVCQSEGIDGETADLARLVVSELVTNSVVHGASDVSLELSVTPEALGGQVTDHGAGMPTLLQAPLEAEGGRGLTIVAATTAAWGVQDHPEGKTVWFELPRFSCLRPSSSGRWCSSIRPSVNMPDSAALTRRGARG